jgi:hypothetical protein
MNSGGPPPTHGKHSPKSAEPMKVSRQSSEDKLYSAETKLESSDDFNIPDLSSAINFSKFMNKSRAESKEMMMGGEDDDHHHHNTNRVADAKHEYKEEPVHNQYKHHVEEEPEEVEEEEEDEYNFDYSKSKLLNKDRLAPLPSHDTINNTAVSHSHSINHDHHNHSNLRDKLDRRASEESDGFTDDYEEILYKKDNHNHNNLGESKTDDHHPHHNTTREEEEEFSHSQPKHSTAVPHTAPPVHEEKHNYDEDEEEEEAVEEVLEEIAENLEELSHEFEESKQSAGGSTGLIEPTFHTRSEAKVELTPPTSVSPKSPSDFKSHSHSRSHDEKLDYQPSRRGEREPLPSLSQKKPLSSSSLPALGELKVPNRSNPPPSFLEEKKHSEEKEPAGPELDSDEGEEEDYSQLDQEISQEIANKSFEKGELLPQDNFPHVQSKVVASKYDDGSQSNSHRVSVNRLNQQGVIRSTKGWNDIDERRYEGFDAEEDVDDEDETDQTELPLQQQQHSKNLLPGRHPTHHHQPPARNLQLLDADDSRNSHDISFSQDDQDGTDNHPTEQNENILNSSYRSNQEEEEDEGKEIVINHEEEEGEDFYEDEDEEAEETPIVFEKPKHSLFVSKDTFPSGRQETTHPSHHHQEPAFTMTNKNKQQQPEQDEDEEEEEEEQNYDDYGDDFENEDEHNTSRLSQQGKKGATTTTTMNHPPHSKRAEEKEDEMEDIEEDIEEDIPEEEEEEEGKGKDEMSVGGNVSIPI